MTIAKQLLKDNKRVLITRTDGKQIGGVLTFAGYNNFFKRDQVTLDRLPIWLSEIKSIEEFIDNSIFKK